jgi:hypothetical protein
MRVVALVLAYIGIFLLITVTHLAGLWTYPSLRSSESSSGGGSENASNATTDSSTDAARTSSSKKPSQLSGTTPEESSPIVTQAGYIVAPRCALWSVEALDLYYSPADPSAICVQPPDSPVRNGSQPTPRSAQMPLNCAVAPDSAVYCLVGGQLTADTLKTLYERGELQTPKESREGDRVKEGAVEAQVPEHLTVSPPDTHPPPTPAAADLPPDYPAASVADPAVSPTSIPTPSYQEPIYEEEEEDGGYVYWYTYWY